MKSKIDQAVRQDGIPCEISNTPTADYTVVCKRVVVLGARHAGDKKSGTLKKGSFCNDDFAVT